MPTRSQRHLREIQGVDSAGDGSGAPSVGVPTVGDGSISVAAGTVSSPAVISLVGTFNAALTVSCAFDTDEPDSGTGTTGALASESTAIEVAILLAASFDADPNLVSVAVGRRVEVYATGAATTVTLSSFNIA